MNPPDNPQKGRTWLSKAAILAIHGRLLAEHGGVPGLRDEGLLESALAGPRNHFQYGEHDIFLLASESDAVNAVLALSKGEIGFEDFGKWLRLSSVIFNSAEDGPS